MPDLTWPEAAHEPGTSGSPVEFLETLEGVGVTVERSGAQYAWIATLHDYLADADYAFGASSPSAALAKAGRYARENTCGGCNQALNWPGQPDWLNGACVECGAAA